MRNEFDMTIESRYRRLDVERHMRESDALRALAEGHAPSTQRAIPSLLEHLVERMRKAGARRPEREVVNA